MMFAYGDGLVFLIDVGMSRAPELDHSKGSLLKIESIPSARAVAIDHDGSMKELWPKP
jgi:hypothetical protein